MRSARDEEVARALGDRHAYIAGIGGDVVVFDEKCESQDPQVLEALGAQLSRVLRRSVLGVLNHDDDILLVKLHRDGECLINYNSSPGYFDGQDQPPSAVDVGALCESLNLWVLIR